MRLTTRVHYDVAELPELIGELENIVFMRLNIFKELESLPPLPLSLVEVNIADCMTTETVSDLSELENLEELNMVNCEKAGDVLR